MPGLSGDTSFCTTPSSTHLLCTTRQTPKTLSQSRQTLPPVRQPRCTNEDRSGRTSFLASDNHARGSLTKPTRANNGFATVKRYIASPKASKLDVAENTSNTALSCQQRAFDTLTQFKRLDPLSECHDSGISSDNDSTVSQNDAVRTGIVRYPDDEQESTRFD